MFFQQTCFLFEHHVAREWGEAVNFYMVHREMIFQSWLLLTPFFNFPIVQWILFIPVVVGGGHNFLEQTNHSLSLHTTSCHLSSFLCLSRRQSSVANWRTPAVTVICPLLGYLAFSPKKSKGLHMVKLLQALQSDHFQFPSLPWSVPPTQTCAFFPLMWLWISWLVTAARWPPLRLQMLSASNQVFFSWNRW